MKPKLKQKEYGYTREIILNLLRDYHNYPTLIKVLEVGNSSLQDTMDYFGFFKDCDYIKIIKDKKKIKSKNKFAPKSSTREKRRLDLSFLFDQWFLNKWNLKNSTKTKLMIMLEADFTRKLCFDPEEFENVTKSFENLIASFLRNSLLSNEIKEMIEMGLEAENKNIHFNFEKYLDKEGNLKKDYTIENVSNLVLADTLSLGQRKPKEMKEDFLEKLNNKKFYDYVNRLFFRDFLVRDGVLTYNYFMQFFDFEFIGDLIINIYGLDYLRLFAEQYQNLAEQHREEQEHPSQFLEMQKGEFLDKDGFWTTKEKKKKKNIFDDIHDSLLNEIKKKENEEQEKRIKILNKEIDKKEQEIFSEMKKIKKEQDEISEKFNKIFKKNPKNSKEYLKEKDYKKLTKRGDELRDKQNRLEFELTNVKYDN